MIKRILLVLFITAMTPLTFYIFLIFENNKSINEIHPKVISNSLDRSITWLIDNREKSLTQDSAILWWMIKRSSEITNDHRLLDIYNEYKNKYMANNLHNVWRKLFTPYGKTKINPDSLNHLPDYNLYFIYGLTCNTELGQLDIIQRQKNTNFCRDTHPISPACVTHQLMGLRFRQDQNCGDKKVMASQEKDLQRMIKRQLTWDPRLIDVYIQRVLMLVDTGRGDEVKNQWLQNILNVQSNEGGWGDFQSLLALSDKRHIGFYSRGIKFGKPTDTLHATAQGILLMSLLAQDTEDSEKSEEE